MANPLPCHAPPVTAPPGGLTIGRAAAACGLSVDTLRYYEREGLTLSPAPRSAAGQRRYRDRDLAWLAGVVCLRETGMPIAEIRELADLARCPGNEADRLLALGRHRQRVVEQLRRTRRNLAAIDRQLEAYRRVCGGACDEG